MQLIRPFFEKGVRGLKPSLNHKMIFKRTITWSQDLAITFKKGVLGFKRVNHKMIFKRKITVKEITGVTFKKGVFGLKVTNLLESKPSVQKNFVLKIDY